MIEDLTHSENCQSFKANTHTYIKVNNPSDHLMVVLYIQRKQVEDSGNAYRKRIRKGWDRKMTRSSHHTRVHISSPTRKEHKQNKGEIVITETNVFACNLYIHTYPFKDTLFPIRKSLKSPCTA